MGIARPSGATEGRPSSGSLGAGRGRHAFLRGDPPFLRTRCVRFGEAESPVGARESETRAHPDLGSQRENAWRVGGHGWVRAGLASGPD